MFGVDSATVEGCGDTQFTADLCNVYNIRYMVYDTYIYLFMLCTLYLMQGLRPQRYAVVLAVLAYEALRSLRGGGDPKQM